MMYDDKSGNLWRDIRNKKSVCLRFHISFYVFVCVSVFEGQFASIPRHHVEPDLICPTSFKCSSRFFPRATDPLATAECSCELVNLAII